MTPTDPLRTVSLPLRQLDQILPYSRDDTGFLYWPDAWGTPALGIESERLSECVDEVNRRGLKGVFASGRFFQDDDLDFLTQLPKTEMVEFWDTPMQDVSGLHGLNGLRYLRLSCKRPAMDYSEIAPLTHLVLEHKARDRNLGSQESLEDLRVWRFKPKSGDFRSLQLSLWPGCGPSGIAPTRPRTTTTESSGSPFRSLRPTGRRCRRLPWHSRRLPVSPVPEKKG